MAFSCFLAPFVLVGAFLLVLSPPPAHASLATEPTPPATTLLIVGEETPPLKTVLESLSQTAEGHKLNGQILWDLYRERQFAPVWDARTPQGREAVATLISSMKAYVLYHGVEPSPLWPEAETRALSEKPDDQNAALKLDILMTNSLIELARRMRLDTVNLSHLYVGWPFDTAKGSIVQDLGSALRNNALDAYFSALAPEDDTYKRLAEALETYRVLKNKGGWPTFPSGGPTLKPGQSDTRVPLLRARLEAEGYALPPATDGTDQNFYDEALKTVVESYQARNGLEVDGEIGAKTQIALNTPVEERLNQIAANMERARHMPRDWPERHVLVNIAATSVQIVEKGQVVYHAPTITGRTTRKTPFIKSAIRSVIFNPAWHVPAKIAREDILPKLRKDPHYLEKMGFVINGSADDPHGAGIDWNAIDKSEFAFRLRQSPGDMNSLGRIKFDFDNTFAVYMHGTPHEELFEKADRHLSSGCVRLKDPEAFAVFVLAGTEGLWTEDAVKEEIEKGRTRWLKVAQPLPLFFIYQTAHFPSPSAPLHFAPDAYGYDRLLTEALKRNI